MNKEKKVEMVLNNLLLRIDNCKNITDLEKLIKIKQFTWFMNMLTEDYKGKGKK